MRVDYTDPEHPRMITAAMRRHGLSGQGLAPLRRFWQAVSDRMAAECTFALVEAIERAIKDHAEDM